MMVLFNIEMFFKSFGMLIFFGMLVEIYLFNSYMFKGEGESGINRVNLSINVVGVLKFLEGIFVLDNIIIFVFLLIKLLNFCIEIDWLVSVNKVGVSRVNLVIGKS